MRLPNLRGLVLWWAMDVLDSARLAGLGHLTFEKYEESEIENIKVESVGMTGGLIAPVGMSLESVRSR